MAEVHERRPRVIEKSTRFLIPVLIVSAIVIILVCFAAGYIAGFFTPRSSTLHSSSEANNASSDLNLLKNGIGVSKGISPIADKATVTAGPKVDPWTWRNGPCPVLKADRCPTSYAKNPPLLMVSFDGFRADYLQRPNIPAFKRVKECGVHATSMRPIYPSITFPNHYTIATGLYAESHGIVDNVFYDPNLKRQFSYSNGESIWWQGEPIWVTAKKQGKRANTYFFVGSEAEIQGIRPDVWLHFNESHSYDTRVDTVLEWLTRADYERPDVTLLYFEEPDSTGHKFGPDSHEMTVMVTGQINSALDRLMQGLYDRDLLHCVNVLLVSDHGMQKCDVSLGLFQDVIDASSLRGILQPKDYIARGGAMGRLYLQPTSAKIGYEELYHALQCKERNSSDPTTISPYQVYRKKDIPRRFHYSNTPRVESVIMTLKAGYTIGKKVAGPYDGGDHGYDNLYTNMQAIFLAYGPSLKSDMTIEPFQTIELYNLMCDLINVKPAPNNGTYGSLHHILRTVKNHVPDFVSDRPMTPRFPNNTRHSFRSLNHSCRFSCPIADALSPDRAYNVHVQLDSEFVHHLSAVLPYGVPGSDNTTLLLANTDYAVGYNTALRLPSWLSFNIVRHKNLTNDSFSVTCLRDDLRLDPEQTLACSDDLFGVSFLQASFLFPPEMASTVPAAEEARLMTNVVPMYKHFRDDLWSSFWRMLGLWTENGGTLNVISGPAFDIQYPHGFADPIESYQFLADFPHLRIPSHYFVIVTKGANDSVSCHSFDCLPSVLAFIFPHNSEIWQPCQDIESFILTHSATVQDVEKITGLRFYTNLSTYDAIRMRTLLPTKLRHKQSGL